MNKKQIDFKVKIYSQIPIKMDRHVTVYPSIKECLEYKQKLTDQSKNA